MRLWHKDLICVLPKKQLLGQWREVCLIAKEIATKGTPNHVLVNKVMYYDLQHLHYYASMVSDEMEFRGYKCDFSKFTKWIKVETNHVGSYSLFYNWHNDRYLKQCYYNLQEKYDCGAITYEEWRKIHEHYMLIQEGLI